jgi:CBS domain containing-hemolysin-like protein
MSEAVWLLAACLLCLGFSFWLSGMEAGVFALSRLRIRQQAHAGNPAARLLHGYLESPESFLWTILIGNTFANFTAVSTVLYLTYLWLGQRPWLWLAVWLVLAFLLHAVTDLLPKMLFRQFPNRLCLRTAHPFRLVRFALSPLVSATAWLAETMLRWTGGRRFTGRLFGDRDELRLVMQESAQALTTEERSMINRVLDLQNLRVGDVTVPLDKVVTVTMATPIGEVFRLCREAGLTRLPVRGREPGRMAGYVNLKTSLYRPDLDLNLPAGDFLQPALFLEESVRLEAALRRLQRPGQRMAIVLGRDGREAGIITLEDILRSVFGEVSLT